MIKNSNIDRQSNTNLSVSTKPRLLSVMNFIDDYFNWAQIQKPSQRIFETTVYLQMEEIKKKKIILYPFIDEDFFYDSYQVALLTVIINIISTYAHNSPLTPNILKHSLPPLKVKLPTKIYPMFKPSTDFSPEFLLGQMNLFISVCSFNKVSALFQKTLEDIAVYVNEKQKTINTMYGSGSVHRNKKQKKPIKNKKPKSKK